MATISIDYNSAKKEIYLCGDVAAIKRNRFAWRYVRDYLSPREEDDRIVIPVMEEEPFAVLSSILCSSYSARKILVSFAVTFCISYGFFSKCIYHNFHYNKH